MGELGIRIRTILGALPLGLERLGRAAVGSPSQWGWLPPAVPWLVAAATAVSVWAAALAVADLARGYPALATIGGGAVGAVVMLGVASMVGEARLGAAGRMSLVVGGTIGGSILAAVMTEQIVAAPLAAATVAGALVGGAVLGWRLQIARSAQAAATTIGFVPGVIWALLVLGLVPVLQAGSEIIVARATVPQFIDRRVDFRTSLVEIEGLALLPPPRAEAPIDPERGPAAGSYHWYALRDALSERRMALVRSAYPPSALRRREITARIRDDIAVDGALAAMRGQGMGDVPATALPVALQGLDPESAAARGEVRELGSLAELEAADREPGSLVRLTLDVPGEAVASCVLDDSCLARRLAVGIGPWLYLARDADSRAAAVLQLPYPPSVAPFHALGWQARDPAAVGRTVDGLPERYLLGWAQVLRSAIIEHDLNLPVDRLWLGPILFLGLATLLWLGRRTGYPIFSPIPSPSRRWADTARSAGPVSATGSGRLSSPGRSPLDLVEAPLTLSRVGGVAQLQTADGDERVVVTVPRALGALSGMEPGELRYLRSRRPALRVGWYGSQVLLVFESADDRDAAAALLSALD